MKGQTRATLPMMIMLSAVMILVPIVAGSGRALPEAIRSGEQGGWQEQEIPIGEEGRRSVAADRALSPAETSGAPRAIFLLALLVVTSAATADVLFGEFTRRRSAGAAGNTLHATLHDQARERTMS